MRRSHQLTHIKASENSSDKALPRSGSMKLAVRLQPTETGPHRSIRVA